MNRFGISSVLIAAVTIITSCSSKPTLRDEAGYKGIGTDSVDAKALESFAAPPLPPELSRKIQNYFDIRSPGPGLLSPDQKQFYFSWKVTGTSQIWKLDTETHFPVQLTGGEENTELHDITPDGRWLIISRDRNGEENPGLYLQNSNGGPLIPIQHKTKVQTVYEFLSKDSKSIYYRANDIKPDSYAFYRYDIGSRKTEKIFEPEGLWSSADFRDDGKILLSKSLTNSFNEVYEFDIATKTLKPIIGQGEHDEYRVGYGANPGEFLVLTSKLGDYRRLYSLKNGKLTAITPTMNWDVSGYIIDEERHHIVYTVNEGGYSKGFALDAKTLKPIHFPTFKNADQVVIGKMARNGQTVMISLETSQGPRISYSYNFKTQKLKQWVVPSQPEIDTSKFARATLESYPARDGTQIPMFVRRPEQCPKPGSAQPVSGAKPCPVVVSFHGGPEGQSRPGFNVFAQTVVDEGMIYVEPNVRGSDGYGKTYFHSDDGPKRLNVITDIEDASLYIKKSWAVGGVPPKIGITGGSYGGYSTLVGMTMFAGAYDVGVSIVGMSNLETFLMNTAPYRRAMRTPEYGDPVKDKEALIKLSPWTYRDRVRSPLMIIQGANDPRVPVGEALQIHRSLEAKGIPSTLIVFPDEGHVSGKRSNRVLQAGHTLRFLKQHLVGQ